MIRDPLTAQEKLHHSKYLQRRPLNYIIEVSVFQKNHPEIPVLARKLQISQFIRRSGLSTLLHFLKRGFLERNFRGLPFRNKKY